MIRIGVDFGGTKIEAAALDADGRFLERVREPNPGSYDAALVLLRSLIDRVEAKVGRAASVGVGLPGSVSPKTGVARNANTTWLNGRSFREDLAQALGRPVRVANDANCLALSEATDGAGAGANVVFAVILGTGCGGGVTAGGQLIEGVNGIGGEWGHIPLPWPGGDGELPAPKCWCGQTGCLELYCSGTGFQDDYRRATGKSELGARIVELMRTGDAQACASFARYADRLGRALAVVCNIIDPDVIVLGGGMSNVVELYDALRPIIAGRIFSDVFETPIRQAVHGDSSGVRGAAWLWPAE
jgi:fructokinase